MKPLNLDNRPCSPISSNCVIWQGPDIACINLCAGDSVSDVTYKLATELCIIMDQLNVTNYDLSCLITNGCPPADFHDLIQLLINSKCDPTVTTTKTETVAGCPDCVVTVAPCFVQGTQTTMQLVDYVQLVANRICSIIDELLNINNQLTAIDATLNDLQYQIDNLPTYTLPSINTDCLLVGSNPIDTVLETLMNDTSLGYCRLISSTGTPSEINSAVLSQCVADSDHSFASGSPGSAMSVYYAGTWIDNASLTSAPTVANAINNAWIAICDIRTGLETLGNTEVAAGNGVTVTSSTVGSTTTYTVSTLGALRAQGIPTDLPKISPTSSLDLYDGVTQHMTEVYDDDSAYNPATGIWTCPATGIYNLSFYVHLSNEDPTPVGFTSGMVVAGIVNYTPRGFYAVDMGTINQVTRHVDITGSALGMNITAGDRLILKILNCSDVDYVGYAGDVARLVIQRVR